MNEPPLFLGIDLGTSSCKVVLCEGSGRVLGGETGTYPLILGGAGAVEQDPEAWWRAIGSCSKALLSRLQVDLSRVAAIGATGQWSGTVAVGQDQKALRPAIIWMDTRGEPFVRELTGGFPSVEGYRLDKLFTWLRRTGGAPAHAGKDSLAHILYLKHQEPDVYRATHRFLEPKDFLNLRLTGSFSASWDNVVVTWVTNNRDPARVVYDDRLFRLASLDRAKFPPLKAPTDQVGCLTPEAGRALGLPSGIPVVAGAGDMQASLVGCGCVRPGQFHLYLGTSSWLTAHVPFKRTDVSHNIAALPSALTGSYLIVATQESAGSSLAYARELLFDRSTGLPPYEELVALAARAKPAEGGVLFTPWLYGERAPVEDRNLRGAVFNLSLGTGRAQLLRAVLEGVAYNTRWILDPVERMAGARAEPIRVGGGGGRSPLWCQILADVLQRTVEVIADPEYATSRGAAMLGAVGTGHLRVEALSGSVPMLRRHVPDPSVRATYDDMFRAYVRFHAANSAGFRALNERD